MTTKKKPDKERIVLRVSKTELKRIEKAAANLGLTTAQYCKLAAFEKVNSWEGGAP